MNELPDYKKIEIELGYTFNDPSLLRNSLRHSSYVNELTGQEKDDNERLEFLGDAVVNLIVGDLLIQRFPEHREGDLSRMRSSLVNETSLADIARSINLGDYILLGKGERLTRGHDKSSILSDAYEALVAAVYIDGGYDNVWHIVKKHFIDRLPDKSAPCVVNDSKSMLQEIAQTDLKVMPQYKVVEETGPDHDKTFKVRLKVNDIICHGTGKSKKTAEQSAAGKALREINNSK
jgi:ribonuclease III